MFGEKLNGTDPEDVIRNAFACFDEEGTGETETKQAALLASLCTYAVRKTTYSLVNFFTITVKLMKVANVFSYLNYQIIDQFSVASLKNYISS